VPFTPYFALAGQCDGPAPHMLDLNWVPIVGATVIKKDIYERFPSQALDAIRKASSVAGEKLRARSRQENDEAVSAMRKRGLKVVTITAEVESEWRQMAEGVYPKIRGKMVPADMFDEVQRLLAEKRAIEPGTKK
jgi:TRAP-type C4-dicarboxylate transport system substrate-binding protein